METLYRCKEDTVMCEHMRIDKTGLRKYYMCYNKEHFPKTYTAREVARCRLGEDVCVIEMPEWCMYRKLRDAECDMLKRKLKERYW